MLIAPRKSSRLIKSGLESLVTKMQEPDQQTPNKDEYDFKIVQEAIPDQNDETQEIGSISSRQVSMFDFVEDLKTCGGTFQLYLVSNDPNGAQSQRNTETL